MIAVNDDAELTGLIFYGKNDLVLLEAGRINDGSTKKVIELADGERLIGVRAQLFNNTKLRDLQFVIGRID